MPAVSHRGTLELLPLEALEWPDFESLQWRILRDVEGLRHAQIYGNPGQAQLGLDVVAVAADESGVALQSKRVQQFGPAAVTAAVKAFRSTSRPFDVSRFIIGVSREVRTRAAIDRFKELRDELKPVELELWDKRELSMRLKKAPLIVIEYFGLDIAERFCDPFEIGTTVVPPKDVVAVQQAIARTPEVTTGADAKIEESKGLTASDPDAALSLVEEAQSLLVQAGFAGHAAQYDEQRAALLVAVGRGIEATRRRLDQMWVALEQGQGTLAQIASNDIDQLAARVGRKPSRDHNAVSDAAIDLYQNPLAYVPELRDLLKGELGDKARLAALAGETALADGNQEWLKRHAGRLLQISRQLIGPERNDGLQVRLRVLAAEGTGRWASVLHDARTSHIEPGLAALVKARHARHLALDQRFAEADAGWSEAAGSACLAGRWTDAARWIFSRRTFRTRWQPFTSDQLLPVQTALLARGPDATIVPRDDDALEYAYGQHLANKPRPAAIAAQRALRDAVTLSDWEGERSARRILALVLGASGEPAEAASHLVRASDVTALKELATGHQNRFIDVTRFLSAKPYWIAGAAYRFTAEQADLVPDELVRTIVENVARDLAAAADGSLVDLVAFTSSRYLGAFAAIAGLSERLAADQADLVLQHIEALPDVEDGHYRHTDDDVARTLGGIVSTHPQLVERTMPLLVTLLARSQTSRKSKAHDAVTDRLDAARTHLTALAASGNTWAQEVLATKEPDNVDAVEIAAALVRIETPLTPTPGVYEVGAGSAALPDSALVRRLPARKQQKALTELVSRGSNPYVSGSDRASYFLAASNLSPPPDKTARAALLERCLKQVLDPTESEADASQQQFSHPLGAFRITTIPDSRAQAAYVAAGLARTQKDKEQVRQAILNLIGDDTVSAYWRTRAIQRLGDTMAPDVGFLSGQDWAAKSLSSILWAKTTEPGPVGMRLAADPDVRVRRALASNVFTARADDTGNSSQAARLSARNDVLERLLSDPCYSVRLAASTGKV